MNKLQLIIIIISASTLFGLSAHSQAIHGTVYEIVSNKEANPLPGVNIYWSGTTRGTVSNNKGKFEIRTTGVSDKKLVFSFMGYKTDTVEVGDRKEIEVQLLAENKQLKEVVIQDHSAGSYISTINPRKVQVITKSELARAACCNLSESFETNASVDVNYSDAITGAKQIQLLGLSGVYSQVISENVPLIRGLATSFGLSYIPGPWMESIQISKGTSSVANGYESITGQINVEYKKPATSEPFYINLFLNDFLRKEVNINSRYMLNERLSTMAFLHYDDQEKKFDHNHDGFRDLPELRNIHVFNRWDYIIPGRFDSRFGIKYMKEDRLTGLMNFDKKTFRDDTVGIGTLSKSYGMEIKTRRMESFWKNGLIFKGDHYTSLALIVSGIYHDQDGFLGLNQYQGREKSFNANLLFSFQLFNEHHKITSGINLQFSDYAEHYFRKDFTYLYQLSGIINDTTLFKIVHVRDTNYRFDRIERVPGAFLEYTVNFREKLTLIGGIRVDHHNKYGSFFTPRLHIRYKPGHDIAIRASAGKGYRTANLLSENFSLMASQREIHIQPSLKMEEAWNYGINLTKDFTVLNRKLQLDLEYYHTDFINQVIADMDSTPSGAFFYNLQGKSYSNSLQAQLSWEILQRLNILVAYRMNDVWTTIGGKLRPKPFVNAYKGLATLSYSTKFDKWKFDITGQFNGPSRIPDTQKMPVSLQRASHSPAHFILLGQVTRKYKNLEVYIGGENLTDYTQPDPITEAFAPYHTHFDTSMVWGPIIGRTIYGGLRWFI